MAPNGPTERTHECLLSGEKQTHMKMPLRLSLTKPDIGLGLRKDPELISACRYKFPVPAREFPVQLNKFPVLMFREFASNRA